MPVNGFPAAHRSPILPLMVLALALSLAGCGGVLRQVQDRMAYTDISMGDDDLERYGVGFLTPAAATTREADKQALALAFAKKLEEMRPGIRVVPMPAILSAVNAADLDQEYKQMYRDYLETGILDGAVLNRIGLAGGVRYLVQLNLAAFDQQTRSRFSLFGLRLVETKQANMRVFVQIWDSQTGAVAWEGGGELNYAYETTRERPVTFQTVAEAAAQTLFRTLPPHSK
jgi:hypothetical protein